MNIYLGFVFYCIDLVDEFTVGLEQKQQLKVQFVQPPAELQLLERNDGVLNVGVVFPDTRQDSIISKSKFRNSCVRTV